MFTQERFVLNVQFQVDFVVEHESRPESLQVNCFSSSCGRANEFRLSLVDLTYRLLSWLHLDFIDDSYLTTTCQQWMNELSIVFLLCYCEMRPMY